MTTYSFVDTTIHLLRGYVLILCTPGKVLDDATLNEVIEQTATCGALVNLMAQGKERDELEFLTEVIDNLIP